MSQEIPVITEFEPLPLQLKVIRDIRRNFDYSIGTHEVLLSGAVGSAKSILLAHLIVTHCIDNPMAHVGIGRRVFKDLKDTLIEVIREHCGEVVPAEFNGTTGKFTFRNGSVIRPFSWADRHYKKFRSHAFSMFVVEELTENSDEEFFDEISTRVGRLKGIREKLIVAASNPDEPEHWAYKRFFLSNNPRRHVYLSKTSDNPYLPPSYVAQLRESLDPLMARRLIDGEWLSIRGEVIYYAYDPEHNRIKKEWHVKEGSDIHWCWDFNIGDGKPLSTCFFQHDGKAFHVFSDICVEGLRTEDMLEEAWGKGLLDHDCTYVIHGDATGRHKDTRSRHSDWEIIRIWLSNARNRLGKPIRFRMEVPLSNPKVRHRHNTLNGVLHNSAGQRSLFVYDGAKKTHEGLLMTKLKPGADYIEDDSKDFQHVTTALGYGVLAKLNASNKSSVSVLRR